MSKKNSINTEKIDIQKNNYKPANQILKEPENANNNAQNITNKNNSKNNNTNTNLKENNINNAKKEDNQSKVNTNQTNTKNSNNITIEKSKNSNNTTIEKTNHNQEKTLIDESSSQKTFHPISEKSKYSKKEIIGLSLIIIFIIIFSLFILLTLISVNNKNMLSGISILGIDVSKQSKEDALQTVNNIIDKKLPDELKLIHNDYETSIATESLGISFDIESAIDEAYKIGRNGNILENDLAMIKTLFTPVDITPNFTMDEEQLKTTLADISSKLPDTVKQSSYYIEDGNLILTKGRTGNVIKIDEMANYIKNLIQNLAINNTSIEMITQEESPTPLDIEAIHNEIYKQPSDAYFTQDPYAVYPSENGLDFAISVDEAKAMLQEEKEEYVIPLQVLYPNVTTNMIGQEAFPDLLSSFPTYYNTRDKDRTTNLILAANKINGTVVMPGEVFSYNTVVGERTIAAGYKEAPIYVNGQVEDGLGGGICQVTSTLYNAVVYANLEIVERSNHQFVPSYVTASRDATVVYGSIDFKFRNNRNYPIKILCSVSNGVVNFQIYGLKTDNEYEVEISSRITSQNANYTNSEAYKILKQNGQVVSTTLLSRDTYKRH